MLKLLNTKTQKYSAVMMTGAMIGFSNVAHATGNTAANGSSFGAYTTSIANNVAPGWMSTITNVALLGGVALAALGVVNLKQHVENPGNVPMKNGLAKLGFGGILMALGPVISAVQGTAGATSATVAATPFTITPQ
jgi:hypothetical protein